MLLLDTSGLLSALDGSQRHHERSARALSRDRGPYLLSPFVLAELDYLLGTLVGKEAEMALLDEVGRGAYDLEPFSVGDVARAAAIVTKNVDLDIGLTDASIVVLAERYKCRRILTLDERHFRAVSPRAGSEPFVLLPADG